MENSTKKKLREKKKVIGPVDSHDEAKCKKMCMPVAQYGKRITYVKRRKADFQFAKITTLDKVN